MAGLVLAAGAGTRLAPLTRLRPKALCPVGNVALLDHALDAIRPHVDSVAVNVHHGAERITAHLRRRDRRRSGTGSVHVAVEHEEALGTAGAVAGVAGWLSGRAVLLANADAWHRADLSVLLEGWSGDSVRVLSATPGPFGPQSTVVASLLPASRVTALAELLTEGTRIRPAGLWEACWAHEVAAGRLETVHTDAPFVDCGTPADYLAANLWWARLEGRGDSVVAPTAVVEGTVTESVVWDGARVAPEEHLRRAIRADGLTVLVR